MSFWKNNKPVSTFLDDQQLEIAINISGTGFYLIEVKENKARKIFEEKVTKNSLKMVLIAVKSSHSCWCGISIPSIHNRC